MAKTWLYQIQIKARYCLQLRRLADLIGVNRSQITQEQRHMNTVHSVLHLYVEVMPGDTLENLEEMLHAALERIATNPEAERAPTIKSIRSAHAPYNPLSSTTLIEKLSPERADTPARPV